MACGVPVITSNTSSMPEVAGDAAVKIDPTKPEDIARAIHSLLNNAIQQKEMAEKGIERARQFSWENNATKTLHIYKTLAGQ
jgi:glycosyltransferase involved in cell wall biosynthesis